MPGDRRFHHPDFDKKGLEGWRAVHREAALPQAAWRAERDRAVSMGLPGAESMEDGSISTFARGELPHYAGINTFLKAPYVENVRDAGKYEAAILGAPFASGRRVAGRADFFIGVADTPLEALLHGSVIWRRGVEGIGGWARS